MEIIAEYRTRDKCEWERGPWDNEPDKVQMRDEVTGLPCLIVRGPSGALCGYVGVPAGHPWHGVHYNNVGLYEGPDRYDPDWYPEVHGGLTYSDSCRHDESSAEGICHVPQNGEADDVWWLGFDCAHLHDYTRMSSPASFRERDPHSADVYRDIEYVKAECAKLASQAASQVPHSKGKQE